MPFRLIIGLFLLHLTCLSFQSNAQCRGFARKECKPNLQPYIHNGQMNNVILFQGESAELLLTFYSGQDYRLLVCGEKKLSGLYFQVLDTDKNILYTNKNEETGYWDFKVGSTQQLLIKVSAPDADPSQEVIENGCCSVLIGFKE